MNIDEPNDWLLDPLTHDLVITDDLAWTYGVAGIAQDIKIAVQMIMGEWFADVLDGIPYWERDGIVSDREALLGGKYSQARYEQVFRARIIKVPGVATVDEVIATFDTTTRAASVAWSVTTIFGTKLTGSETR